MLKEIHFKNWKSFKNATLYIDQITVLIGTNASGKTNIVEGLEFLRRLINGKEVQTALVGDSSLSSIRGGLEWAALKPENQFTISLLVEGNENTDYFYSVTVELVSNQAEIFAEQLTYIKHLPDSKEHFIKIKRTHVDSETEFAFEAGYSSKEKIYNPKNLLALSNPHFSILSMRDRFKHLPISEKIRVGINTVTNVIQNIFVFNPIPSNMRNYTPLSGDLSYDASNIAGVLANLPKDKNIEDILSAYLKKLPQGDIRRVFAEPVGKIGNDAMLYCEEEWKNGETILIDAHTMSDGTLHFLAILVALLTRPEGSQIVIEDVDNGLHPSRIGLLFKILKDIGEQRNIDILVTTHNPALLDNLGPEMVPYVEIVHRHIETGTSQITLLEDIDNLPKLLASGTLGRITMHGKLEKSLNS
jgi:AAA15 family ATPase/GTPase